MIRQLNEELRCINKHIKELESKLNTIPPGTLCCARNGNKIKWYFRNESSSYSYLPKKERKLAEQLAFKKYAQIELDYFRKKRSAIENYLQISELSSGAEDLLKEESPYRDLILPYYSDHSRNSKKLAALAQAEYISNPDYPDGKKFHTKKGELVRSKSEVFIADALFTHRIPYRYEQKLDLGSAGYFFPDFTVCHPRYLKTIYWEHFGLMDSEDYVHKAYRKLDIYTLNGIIPTLNLITTFETKENPIDSYVIERIIKDYFL